MESNTGSERSKISEVSEFIRADNKVKANNSILECGDGRYTAEQGKGGIRIFGGDFGALMAIKAVLKVEDVEIKDRDLIEKYLNASKEIGRDGKIHFHTDSHNKVPSIGCGHIAKADSGQFRFLYGLEAQEVEDLYTELLHLGEDEKNNVVLEGDHKEKGVLFVKSEENLWSVNSFNGQKMYFVIDQSRIEKYFDDLIPKLGIERLTSSEVKSMYDQQMAITARLLAHGLEKFDVKFNKNGDFAVEPLGKVA
ncbi:MAG TPA: hypothetical protein VFA93_01360 [Patescibacteria group bacterium]|nr:hypothetical protein [Patescibacteria group bacterium]